MWWIPALVQGGMQVASSILSKPKTDTMSETRKLLGTLAGQGVYSSEDIRKTTGAVSQEYATGEQAQTALIRGYLEKAGLGGSIAGAQALSKVQEPRKKAVAETRTGMELENVRTKREATIDYANLVDTLNRNRRLESAQFKRDLFAGMGQAGVGAYQSYMQSKELGLKERQVEAEVGYRGAYADYFKARADKLNETSEAVMASLYAAKNDFEIADWAKKHGWDYEAALDMWSQNQL